MGDAVRRPWYDGDMDGWRGLEDELDTWKRAGRTATLWWRDDDATRDGPALRRLLSLVGALRLPVALAVVPADAEADLTDALGAAPEAVVLQHGWDHVNRAVPPARKAELAAGRPWREVGAELARGRERLSALFPDRFLPVMVPPWNRIDPALVNRLPEAGFRGLSAYRARERAEAAPGLGQVNCHADPVDWRGGRGFAGAEAVLAALVGHLRARREGTADAAEPTGILTHHQVHDEPSWAFLAELAARVHRHAAAGWISLAAAPGIAR